MDPKRRKAGDQDISELRLASRQKYLAEREAQQLALLRRQVAEEAEEEERLGAKLSERERKEFARNRETLRLAEARNQIDEHLDGYILPDADYSNKTEVLTKRHKEKGYEKSEVQLWEDEQTKRVTAQIKKPERTREEDYEFVFDTSNNIAFLADPIDTDKQRLESMLNEAERRAKTIEETRKSLPVYQYKDEFIKAVTDHPVLIVVGQTGSGKTTQLTQYLYEAGFAKNGRIGCTQPRRVAAMSVAQRVAEEMSTKVGQKCGYSVRFETKMSPTGDTAIEYMTDGLLTRFLLSSPALDDYSVIVLDEAHERTISTDILISILHEVILARPEFRLVVASATLDSQKFSRFFGDAPILSIPGRTFPVQVQWCSSPEANYLNAAITTVFQIHLSQPLSEGSGDILVFLTGEDEIVQAAEYITETSRKLGRNAPPLIVAPVYGALPAEDQQRIFQPCPPGSRKVILATNIAETSLTIDGVKFVVDSGLQKESVWNVRTSMSQLVVVPCSRASAEQRAGRAGRTGPGMCFRLYTKYAFYNELPASTVPEILKGNLDSTMLTLKSLNINDVLHFNWLDSPSVDAICASLENLYALGYLSSSGEITKLGRRASELPLDPRLSKALLTADTLGCVDELVTLVAMIQESATLFISPKDKRVAAEAAKQRFTRPEGGDMVTLLNVWNEFVESDYSVLWAKDAFVQYRTLNRVRNVREQLLKLTERVEITPSSSGISDHVKILKAFTAGYFANVARLARDGQSYTIQKQGGLSVYIHPSSTMNKRRDRWICFSEITLTSKEFVRNVAPIDPAWLYELAPHYYKPGSIEIEAKTSKGQGKVGIGQ